MVTTTDGIWSPDLGDPYFLTQDLAAMAQSIQDALQRSSPIGRMDAFAGDAAPEGWLLCVGQAISRADYSALFAVIGTRYGAGNGSTTFNVPNALGRTLVGKDPAHPEFATLGQRGGLKTHTLTIEQMPSHAHRVDGPAGLGGVLSGTNAAPGYSGGSGAGFTPWFGGGYNSRPATNQAVGDNKPHNNLQPYLTINYIIRAK